MKIEISLFIGIVLSSWVIIAFFLEYIAYVKITKIKKDSDLVRRRCEVCASVYFVSAFSGFWHCPLCDSINKEK